MVECGVVVSAAMSDSVVKSDSVVVNLASDAALTASLPASALAGTPGLPVTDVTLADVMLVIATVVSEILVSVSGVVLTDVLLVSEAEVPVSEVALTDVTVSDVVLISDSVLVLTDVLVSDVVLSSRMTSQRVVSMRLRRRQWRSSPASTRSGGIPFTIP